MHIENSASRAPAMQHVYPARFRTLGLDIAQ